MVAISVAEWEGETLEMARISRLDMGAYLCIASNGIPPTVSKQIKVSVDCEYILCLSHCDDSLKINAPFLRISFRREIACAWYAIYNRYKKCNHNRHYFINLFYSISSDEFFYIYSSFINTFFLLNLLKR